MFPTRQSSKLNNSFQLVAIVCVASISFSLVFVAELIGAQPSLKSPFFNEIDGDKKVHIDNKDAPVTVDEQDFRKFVDSAGGPKESTVIGEIKPNASALELMLLRNKIANTILSMQENDRKGSTTTSDQKAEDGNSSSNNNDNKAECYIEVTRVEKIPGKCKRVNGGQPICQSDDLMSISNECS